MRAKFLLVFAVLLLLPLFSSLGMGMGTAAADGGEITNVKKYPGPFGPYEKDAVTVACCQFQRAYDSPLKNLEKIENMTAQAAEKGANIIMFAEFALANYKDPEAVPGPSSLAVAELTKKYSVYVIYGFVEKNLLAKEGDYPVYDSAAIIGPDGIIGVYRKIHLAPTEYYERGDGPVAIDTPWGPVGVAMGYESYSFHELHRTYAMMGARLVLNCADMYDGLGLHDQYVAALHSLVGEDWSFIASANNVGYDSKGTLRSFGQSEIIGPKKVQSDPSYEVVYYAGPASDAGEDIVIANLDLSTVDKIRGLTKMFQPDDKHHNLPTFDPEVWINTWLLPQGKYIVGIKDVQAIALGRDEAQQKADMAAIVAAVLLLSTIVFAIMAFKPGKKK